MDLDDLASRPLTYREVGATNGPLPAGYHHLRRSAPIGRGRACFAEAGSSVMAWGMLRGASLRVKSTTPSAEVGADVLVGLGPLWVPCRVVSVIDEPNRRGFAYGTLPGHAVSGEELFAVRFDPPSDVVYAEVVAFSRPCTWWSRLSGPAGRVAQRLVTKRYLRALRCDGVGPVE